MTMQSSDGFTMSSKLNADLRSPTCAEMSQWVLSKMQERDTGSEFLLTESSAPVDLGAKRIDRPTWLAYLAGYLDGEGCFTAVNSIRVSVSNCYPWLLVEFQKEFGGRVYLKRNAEGNTRTSYQWDVYGDAAARCCELVAPYLIEKRPQALLVIDYNRWPPRSAKRKAIETQLRRLKRTDYA